MYIKNVWPSVEDQRVMGSNTRAYFGPRTSKWHFLQFTFLGDELSPLNAIFLHMWWCLLVWQHDIFINNTLYHPALFQRKYAWCSPHFFLYILLLYPSINYVLFHGLYSQHFFSFSKKALKKWNLSSELLNPQFCFLKTREEAHSQPYITKD